MLNKNTSVTFSYNADANQQTVICESVIFALELLGEVFEDINFNLIENSSKAREHIKIKVELDLIQTNFMAEFLKATDKKLIIEGTSYEVVASSRTVEFGLFQKLNIYSYPTLRFKKKTLGISVLERYIPHQRFIVPGVPV